MKFNKKISCADCIHKPICSIYDFAKKHNEESSVKLRPHTMADVCGHYLKDIDKYSKEVD